MVSCNPITLGHLCVGVDAKRSVSFRNLQQQYGDGYMARRQDGVNPVSEMWDVTIPARPVDEVYALENELIALGTGFFAWTPPNETVPKNWILDPVQWSMEYQSDTLATLSFRLRRWYQ